MNTNHQPTLNGIRLWSETQTVSFNLLVANIAGFEPIRIMGTDRKRGESVVTFNGCRRRKPNTP